jgi:hypothetical protein
MIVSIDSEAQKDLALDEEDAGSVVGGNRKSKKSAKKHHATATATLRPPVMIRQEVTYGPTQISANSGDDDCAPDPTSPDATD